MLKQSSYDKGVSLIVFGKDNNLQFLRTLNEISLVFKKLGDISFEIVLVDDGSATRKYQDELRNRSIKIINLPKSVGISGAVLEGVKNSKFNFILPIPGHDMFSAQGIQNVVSLLGYSQIVIGIRSNIVQERPLIKRIASRLSLRLFQNLISNSISDIHGLILYKKQDLIKYLNYNDGHGISVRMLANIVRANGLIIQTISPIKDGHKKHKAKKYPSFKNVLKVLLIILQETKVIRRKTNQGKWSNK